MLQRKKGNTFKTYYKNTNVILVSTTSLYISTHNCYLSHGFLFISLYDKNRRTRLSTSHRMSQLFFVRVNHTNYKLDRLVFFHRLFNFQDNNIIVVIPTNAFARILHIIVLYRYIHHICIYSVMIQII